MQVLSSSLLQDNSNQTQVTPTDPDYNNYWNDTTNSGVGVALTECMHTEFGYDVYNTLNRRGWLTNWCSRYRCKYHLPCNQYWRTR